jgi:hypothetical protein
MSMKRLVVLAAAAALVVTATPALAKSKKKHRVQHGYYAGQYYAPHPGYPGWTSRHVSDPSFGNRFGINRAYSTGRCVADLGYGRFEYCGW